MLFRVTTPDPSVISLDDVSQKTLPEMVSAARAQVNRALLYICEGLLSKSLNLGCQPISIYWWMDWFHLLLERGGHTPESLGLCESSCWFGKYIPTRRYRF